MKSWTISRRIIAAGITLFLMIGALGFTAYLTLSHLHTYAESRLRDDAIPGIVNIGTMTGYSLRSYTRAMLAESSHGEQREALMAEAKSICDVQVEQALKAYEAAITAPEDRTNFAELIRRRTVFAGVRARFFDLLRQNDVQKCEDFLHHELEPAFASYRDQLAMMLAWNQKVAVSVADESAAEAATAKRAVFITTLAIIGVALAMGWFIIRGINRALQNMAHTLDDASAQTASAASQVSTSSQSLAEGASEQAASLEETSSSLEELSSMTRRNADNAQSAKQLSKDTKVAAESGYKDMTEMRQAMDAIKTSSNDIAKIIKTIDEIAFQTNILALNAAVEAARAGEAGAGFAVVADEVRALAQRSAVSAKETASKIEIAIQNGEHGVQISGKVAQSLEIIVAKARSVDEIIGEIATASNEQSQGIGQINSAVSQMDKVTQSNAGNAEETAAAAEELNAQSVTLQETVGHLRALVGGTHHQTAAHSSRLEPKPRATAIPVVRTQAALHAPLTRASSTLRPVTAGGASSDEFFRDA